jgi:membrane protease YdiL (CAAX protease family)
MARCDVPAPGHTFRETDGPPDTVTSVADASPALATSLAERQSPVRPPQPRWLALFEALLVSGVPTQALVGATLLLVVGMSPQDDSGLSLQFFAALSLIDTLLVVALIRFFLRATGERPRDVFVGVRPVGREALMGLMFVPLVLIVVALVVLGLRAVFPWLQTVPDNPLLALMDTPARAAVFLVIVVLAGGVREELQRAFILHRFEQRLGGIRLGLVLFTITFGALHLDQGADVALAVGLLGLMWGIVYIKRRSAILPIVNHAGFNALQVFQGLVARSFGG